MHNIILTFGARGGGGCSGGGSITIKRIIFILLLLFTLSWSESSESGSGGGGGDGSDGESGDNGVNPTAISSSSSSAIAVIAPLNGGDVGGGGGKDDHYQGGNDSSSSYNSDSSGGGAFPSLSSLLQNLSSITPPLHNINISSGGDYLGDGPFKDLFGPASPLLESKSRSGRSVCKISEFGCRTNTKCISADKFCDGIDHCGDGSDEPRFCSPCNRTYYGEWGYTYSISLSSATIAAALGLSHEQQLMSGDEPHPPPSPPLESPLSSSTPTRPPRNRSSSSGGMSRLRNLTKSLMTTTSTTTQGPTTTTSTTKKPGLPPQFVCQLTFAAAGDNFGDFIQVMFDSVNIGHFTSPSHHGCPDGSLQVAEINRPLTGGKWCGAGTGYAVYFSETSAIALTLGLRYDGTGTVNNPKFPPGSGGGGVNMSSSFISKGRDDNKMSSSGSGSPVDDFEFKIRYKFIPRSLASVRFGTHGNPIERGEVVPGSYCSRDFEACHRRRCRLQTPNYPGLYPRNVSCHFTIRHRAQQPCKHVLIQVSQVKGHKVQLKAPSRMAQSPAQLIQEDALIAWDDCSQGNRDTITIYDGTSTDDPVLLIVCGGGYIPPVTSSKSELLLVFKATPFGNPLELRPSPPYPEMLRGFELDVDVIMVDSESAEYSNYKNNCTFFFVSEPNDKCLLFKPQEHGGNWISGKRGKVSAPRHTISPNTTCRYEFKGTKHEIVWVYFISYSREVSSKMDPTLKPTEANCSSKLSIKDGIDLKNEVPIGSYCDSDLPKLCDHKALQNESRVVRSCSGEESYISAGSRLIIEQIFFEGTALRPINFQFYYEFVSRHSGTDGTCNRHYILSKMKSKGVIRTTDNIFDFGRGGKSNLTCTYTFTLASYEGLRLTVKSASFGDRPCRTVTDFETGRHLCNYIAQGASSGMNFTSSNSSSSSGSDSSSTSAFPRAELRFSETIWPNTNLTSHKHCICSNFSTTSSTSTPTLTFLGRKVQLTFTIENMKGRDSYENYFAHIDYEVLKDFGCRGDNHHMKTESGLISLESTYIHGPVRTPSCDLYPWLLEAKENHSLYLRIPGYPMIEEKSSSSGKLTGKATPAPANIYNNYNYNESSPTSSLDNSSTSGSSGGGTSWHTSTHLDSSSLLPGLAKFQLDRICPTTKNRIFIYDGDNKLVQKICPSSFTSSLSKSPSQIVEIYSQDFGKFHSPLWPPPRARFIIEFVGRELGSYQIKWLELISAKMKTTLKSMEVNPGKSSGGDSGVNITGDPEQDQLRRTGSSKLSWDETLSKLFEGQTGEDDPTTVVVDSSQFTSSSSEPNYPTTLTGICPSYCPELRACISDKLWCDGEVHCPLSNADEKNCDNFWATLNQLLSPAVYIPVAAAALSALCCCGLVILCVAVKRMVINMRDKGQLNLGIPTASSAASSRTSTVDRRQRDYFYDPHQPIS